MRVVILFAILCAVSGQILRPLLPNIYQVTASETLHGRVVNFTYISDSFTFSRSAQVDGEQVGTFIFSGNATIYDVGTGVEPCVGSWVTREEAVDLFAEANQLAKNAGTCSTGNLLPGRLWRFQRQSGGKTVSVELCTDLLGTKPIWTEVNTTMKGSPTTTLRARYSDLKTSIDRNQLILPTICYNIVNSREHPVQIPSSWLANVTITSDTDDRADALIEQDRDGNNVVIFNSTQWYSPERAQGKEWSIYFRKNNTVYIQRAVSEFTPDPECLCYTQAHYNWADETVKLHDATVDKTGTLAVWQQKTCTGNGTSEQGYVWHGVRDSEFCLSQDGKRPISINDGRGAVWNYALWKEDPPMYRFSSIVLPIQCYGIKCTSVV